MKRAIAIVLLVLLLLVAAVAALNFRDEERIDASVTASPATPEPVSYTHLTLPTNREV